MNNSYKGFTRRVETVANLAIIVLAIVVVALLIRRHVSGEDSQGNRQMMAAPIRAGAKLDLQNIDVSRKPLTLFLALSSTCHYCSESAPFYQELVRKVSAETDKIQALALLPQKDAEAKQYLDSLGLSVNAVGEFPLASIGVTGTPTLILVDKSGEVQEVWIGKLTKAEEGDVARSLESADAQNQGHYRTRFIINADELQNLIDSGKRFVMVDVAEREDFKNGHIPGAKNIPLDELEVRAPNELQPSDLIVAYCGNPQGCAGMNNDELTHRLPHLFKKLNFEHIQVLRDGLKGWQQLHHK